MVDGSESRQVYSDDDGSDDHLFEEGHPLAGVSSEPGGSSGVVNVLAG